MRKALAVLLACLSILLMLAGCSLLPTDTVTDLALSEDIKVEFRDESGEVWLNNRHIQTVSLQILPESSNCILFTLTDTGGQALARATEANIGNVIEVWIDGEVVASPTVQEEIEDTVFLMSLGEDYDKCVALFEKMTE